jgi:uncharacterized membrane protein YeaQ/YmgE (transglycosylase-associated protein family)
MGIILWIVFGALAGLVASFIMKTRTGILWDTVIGIVGAVIGGFLASMFGAAGVTGFNLYSFFVAVVGAVVLLAIVKAVSGRGVHV